MPEWHNFITTSVNQKNRAPHKMHPVDIVELVAWKCVAEIECNAEGGQKW